MKTKEELTAEINKMKIEYADFTIKRNAMGECPECGTVCNAHHSASCNYVKITELELQLENIDKFKLRKGEACYSITDSYNVWHYTYNSAIDIYPIKTGRCWIDKKDAETYAKYAKVLNDAVNKERVELNGEANCIQWVATDKRWAAGRVKEITNGEEFLPFFGTSLNMETALLVIGQDGAQALHDVIGRALKVSEVEV